MHITQLSRTRATRRTLRKAHTPAEDTASLQRDDSFIRMQDAEIVIRIAERKLQIRNVFAYKIHRKNQLL